MPRWSHFLRYLLAICAIFGIVLLLYMLNNGTVPKISGLIPPKIYSLINSEQSRLAYCDVFNVEDDQFPLCGRTFDDRWKPYLEKFQLSDEQISQLTESDDANILLKRPVFVTAFSDNHYDIANRSVLATFRKIFPDEKIVIYDLGLRQSYLDELQKLPFVSSIKKFNFSMYPQYVTNLYEYRWKPLLLAELLKQFGAILYADAHVVFKEGLAGNMIAIQQQLATCTQNCSLYPSLLGGSAGLLEYLPMMGSMVKNVTMAEAALQLTFYTKDVRENIYKWYILCALEQNCMGPPGQTIYCTFKDRFLDYAKCHRYDQSAISILLANRNKLIWDRYAANLPFGKV